MLNLNKNFNYPARRRVAPITAAALWRAWRRVRCRAVTFPERSGRSVAFVRHMAPAAFWRAWSIWAVSVAATATALGYTAVHPLPAELASQAGSGLDVVVVVVFIAAFATVGALLAWKRPGNPIGWLLSATGLTYAVGAFGGLLLHFPQTRTLANWLGWIFWLGIGLCVFVLLCFPPGICPPAAGGRWPGPPGQAWPDGRWATRSLPPSSRAARRRRTRSA